jgi:hypothetical protein
MAGVAGGGMGIGGYRRFDFRARAFLRRLTAKVGHKASGNDIVLYFNRSLMNASCDRWWSMLLPE